MKLLNFILTLALVSASLQATDTGPSKLDFVLPKMPPPAASDPYVFALSCYGGQVNGLTKELVFVKTDQGRVYKASQLDWGIQELWVVGGRAAIRFLDEKFRLILDGWGKAASRESLVVDRDWHAEFSFKTPLHISWSPSHLRSAYKIMTEFGFDFYQIDSESAELQTALLIGFQYFQLALKGSGGMYAYNNGADLGFLPSGPGISYFQEYSIPYLGLELNGEWKKIIQWGCFGKISNSAFVHQEDIHHLRGIAYDEEIPNGIYWMVGASFSLSFFKYLDCNVQYSYEQMNETKGTMTIYRENEQPETYLGSGVYHWHQILSLGISSSF